MACYIFGAGDFDGLEERPGAEDYVIAADGGYTTCRRAGVEPQLLLGDFDSLAEVPALPHVERVPVEKDDTDMMLAIKRGLERGETLFHLYGGMGGQRTDHTVANLQALLYLAEQAYDAPFSTPRALGRNYLIHAMGEKTLVAQCRAGSGGTWDGTTENLKHGWSPVFVHDDGTPGAGALIERGAAAVRALGRLDELQPEQLHF